MYLRKKGSLESSIYTKGMEMLLLLFYMHSEWESLEKEMSIIWYSFKVASLFLGGSTDYLWEAWVIPRQGEGGSASSLQKLQGADFSSPLLKAAGEIHVTKPASPDVPSRRSGQARHSEVISCSHAGTVSPGVTAASAGGN